MSILSKASFLAILAATIAFAQTAPEENRSFDDILGSNFVDPSLQQQADSAAAAESAANAAIQVESAATANESKSPAKDSAAADSAGSGSSEGFVLYDASSKKDKDIIERHRRGELVYKYQVTAGWQSPSRGMVSFEYIWIPDILNVGVHFTDYNSEVIQTGIALQYYPMEMRYFYLFLGSDWIHGEYERERDIGKKVYKEYDESLNYWRVVVGIGGEALFMDHLGIYIEAGFEFFAGEGGYYLHMNKKYGYLTNDTFKLPFGIGVLFPF